LVCLDLHSARHIERLNAAYSLERQNFLRFCPDSARKSIAAFASADLSFLRCSAT
jgi:hypothetical protein